MLVDNLTFEISSNNIYDMSVKIKNESNNFEK